MAEAGFTRGEDGVFTGPGGRFRTKMDTAVERADEMTIMNNGWRPHLSPAHPPNGPPNAIPTSPAENTNPSEELPCPNSFTNSGAMKAMTVRS